MTTGSTTPGDLLKLRPYQDDLEAEVYAEWSAGARNVLMRLDTGGGKTPILASIISKHNGASGVIAHRKELVSQISVTLARHGIRHNIIASAQTRRMIIALHIKKFGQSFFDPGSRCAVASVDTLIRADNLAWWFAQVTLWVIDEAHHVVDGNKWATCVKKFTNPSCRGLGPTATPLRADGKGLGAHADGVFHSMVEGPPMRWLIEEGYLTDYRIVCPGSDLEVLEEVGASGDWSAKQLKEAAKRSHIVGDVVTAYRTFAWLRRAIVFATDVETAGAMAGEFRAAGVKAECVTGETDEGYRDQVMTNLEDGRIDLITAVDVVSEGVDIPAVIVGIMARPTQSYQVYAQQFGRVLRPIYAAGFDLETRAGRLAAIAASEKPFAWMIDLVANVVRHQGPPDKVGRVFTLDRRDRARQGAPGIPLRICGAGWTAESRAHLLPRTPCYQPFERIHTECPWCAFPLPEPTTGGRSSPAAVDGDLFELDAETLSKLRGEIVAADVDLKTYHENMTATGLPGLHVAGLVNKKKATQDAQQALRAAMGWFGGYRKAEGKTDRETAKLFFLTFGIDVLSAQALGRADAEALTEKVRAYG